MSSGRAGIPVGRGGSPARELARGRASVVYDLADGTVLRRCTDPSADVSAEAAVMAHARQHGVPVPRVLEASGPDLVMDLVEGPTMLDDLLEHPDRAAAHGMLLARLHQALDRVPPVVQGVDGHRLLHLDLHPGNVLLSGAGPVIVDWTNATSGPRAVDIATTWVVLACMGPVGDGSAAMERVRADLLAAFLDGVGDLAPVRAALPTAGSVRLADPATSEAERRLITDVLRHRTSASRSSSTAPGGSAVRPGAGRRAGGEQEDGSHGGDDATAEASARAATPASTA